MSLELVEHETGEIKPTRYMLCTSNLRFIVQFLEFTS